MEDQESTQQTGTARCGDGVPAGNRDELPQLVETRGSFDTEKARRIDAEQIKRARSRQ